MATAPKNKQAEKVEELAEALDPRKVERKQRVKGTDGSPYEAFDREYTQRRLSALPRLQLVKILSSSINETLKSQESNLMNLMSEVRAAREEERLRQERGEDGESTIGIGTASVFMQLITKLMMNAPETITEILMLSIGVPQHEKDVVRAVWQMPDEEDGSGGLSDDDMFAMIELFIDQNTEALSDFFQKKVPALWQRTAKLLAPSPTSDS